MVFCCSDVRLCKRGLKENPFSEETGDLKTESNSVHSADEDDGSRDAADTKVCEEAESPDDMVLDPEFVENVELMKSMGLPLSFTASECRRKKVCSGL